MRRFSKDFWQNGNPWLLGLVCLGMLCGVLLLLQNATSIDDSIRHITMARLLWESGLAPQNGWADYLFGGYLSLHPVDPWFLLHVSLSPLSKLPLITAQHLIVFLFALALMVAWLSTLRRMKASAGLSSVMIVLLLLGHSQFSMRLLLGRPAFLMVALMILTVGAILRPSPAQIFVIAFISTLLSHLFIFPLFVAATGAVWLLTTGKHRSAFLIALTTVAGCALGIAAHPQSAEYARYLLSVLVRLPFLHDLQMGTEMQTGIQRTGMVFALFGATFLFLLTAYTHRGISLQRLHCAGISWLLFLTITFFFGLLLWVRTLDFLWPITLLLITQLVIVDPPLPTATLRLLFPARAGHPHVLIGILCLFAIVNTATAYRSFLRTDSERSVLPFAEALEDLPSGTKILNVDWDLFPVLFSMRPDLRYARGMDPGFDALALPQTTPLFSTLLNTDPQTVDWDLWVRELTQHYPAEFLLLWTQRHADALPFLLGLRQLHLQTKTSQLTIFSIENADL